MTKKFMATTFLAGCLAVSWLGTHKVHAEQDPEVYFYPAQKWTIEDVSAKAGANEAPVCTLSNTFNNGFKIQFAGTQDGFSNVNIDFRQPVFENDTPYEAHYNVPGYMEKTIPSKAFSDSLLVTDLRKQNEFSAALRSASVIDLSIKDNDFRFYLTGLAASMKDYTNCIQPQGEATALLEESPAPEAEQLLKVESMDSAPPPPTKIDLTAAMPEEESMVHKTADISEILGSGPAPQGEHSASTDRARLTEQLADQLRAERHAMASGATEEQPTPQKTSVKIPAAHFTKETASMEVDLTSVGAADHAADNTETLTARAETENMQSATASLQRIEPGAGTSNENFVDLRAKISDLESRVHKLTLENQALDEELKIALKDAEQERLSVSSENWDLERATMRYNEAERQITRLARKLQTHQAQCDQEKHDLEAMLFDPQLTNQQQLAQLASLEAELEQTKSDLLMNQRKYEERIRLLEGQLNAP